MRLRFFAIPALEPACGEISVHASWRKPTHQAGAQKSGCVQYSTSPLLKTT